MQHTMHAMTPDAHLARATSAHPVELPSVKSNYSEEMTRAGVVGPWDAQVAQCHQTSWLAVHCADATLLTYAALSVVANRKFYLVGGGSYCSN